LVTYNKKFKTKYYGNGLFDIGWSNVLFSWLVSSRLKSKFEHYSKLQLQNGMSGAEIAEKNVSR
jgi:Zn-dependent membrane protease YugP